MSIGKIGTEEFHSFGASNLSKKACQSDGICARDLNRIFLTGDDAFRDFPNVEFVK